MANKIENNYRINPEKVCLETDQGIIESEEKKWGLPLKEVYKHGFTFYKDKEGKALHLCYDNRLKLVAYTQQVAHGPLDLESAPPVGVLDVIGRDRRAAWLSLGHMSQIQAMAGFVHTLDRLCPLFKPFLEAHLKDVEDKKQQALKKAQDEKAYMELQNRIIEEKQNQQSNKITEEQQVQKIKDALNAQTYNQFLQYAQQQYPGNCDQQAVLIRQLQDQHYQQYIQQLAVDKRLANSMLNYLENAIGVKNDSLEIKDLEISMTDCNLNEADAVTDNKLMQTARAETDLADQSKEEDESDSDDIFPQVEDPRMWTRTEIEAFKESARASGGQLSIGHGETVTVRVPTQSRAQCICWEFATDHYDIGFGLYFEWKKSDTTEMTIHVAESEEEDELDDEEHDVNDFTIHGNTIPDAETGITRRRALAANGPPLSQIVPIYRRDCYSEVYAGSHRYPGEGVYLLKFDNTYSLWRSKTLYYKVYYTK